MQPVLVDKNFVFCTINRDVKLNVYPKMMFREKEGTTLILKKEQADENNLTYRGTWDLITLSVNSSLEAVGFLADITKVLAKENISVNAVSAYYHDHLFVPSSKSKQALITLKKLSKS